MKSALGPIILASSGVFHYSSDMKQASKAYNIAKKLYPDFKVSLVNLGNPEEKASAVDVDPDLGDLDSGYAVIIEA
ncbi:hypothetical protein [Metallosphaera hakonensis]|uniref:Uncharacterized protein n=1 Tax=Metallosphaera hakonensis JCM 8857 = DSM 7519 TaxID=1293036 RepID=A0A2U9ITB5_9CREN|nr:hypothetical protein [Metallosphaera hakonensis]AWR99274.1 hypothetical protein DFR87_05655 [Metallosphaera hakonensis JCM 8857 = DSM 7519]